jgi:hypothetical protein
MRKNFSVIVFSSQDAVGRLGSRDHLFGARARAYPIPSAAGDARPSGGQTTTPSASGMRKFRNNRENIIQLPIAIMNSTCCPGSVTCFATFDGWLRELEPPTYRCTEDRFPNGLPTE